MKKIFHLIAFMLMLLPAVAFATYAVYYDNATDSHGNALSGATVHAYLPGTSSLVTLYTDTLGSGPTTTATSDSAGRFHFYVAPGTYDIAVTYHSQTDTKYNMVIVGDGSALTAVGAGGAGTSVTSLTCSGTDKFSGFDSGTGDFTCSADYTAAGGNGGSVTSVASANGDMTVSGATSTVVITLNSGVGANKIVKQGSDGKLPAIDGSNLLNVTHASDLATKVTVSTAVGPCSYGRQSSAEGCFPTIVWPTGSAGIANYNGSSGWGTNYNASNKIPWTFIDGTTASFVTSTTSNMHGFYVRNGTVDDLISAWDQWFTTNHLGLPVYSSVSTTTGDVAWDNANNRILVSGVSGTAFTTYRFAPVGTMIDGDACTYSSTTGKINCATPTSVNPAATIASGVISLGTSTITSAVCSSASTTTATGVATTDVVDWGFNGDPTAVTGYVASTGGMLTIIAYPTTNTINAKVCNNTAADIKPGAITLNWRVLR